MNMPLPLRGMIRNILLFLWLLVPKCLGLIGTDGLCSVFTFVPFTVDGTGTVPILEFAVSPGVSHMATALMAMDHFNSRNTTVVPELADLEGCNKQFDLDKSKIFDTGSITHLASRSLAAQTDNPCAIAGPFHDVPALELSTMAQASLYPLVAHRASNLRVTSQLHNPFSLQTYPDMVSLSEKTLTFLLDKGRTDYIAVYYALTDTGAQRREALGFAFDAAGVEWISSSYVTYGEGNDTIDARTPRGALEAIQESGYRTIVVALEFPFVELPLIADAAEELGLNQGDHLWLFFGNFEPALTFSDDVNIQKIVNGSGWIVPFTGNEADPFHDPFTLAWLSQGKDFVDRVNEENPIKEGEPGYFFLNDTFFQSYLPDYGSSFLYDAVMCIGFGACAAEQENGTVSGKAHYDGIQSTEFTGASGRIFFGDQFGDMDRIGTRNSQTVTFGAFNFNPPGRDGVYFELTDQFSPGASAWEAMAAFVYRDGRTVPPDLLRTTPEQNYLSSGLRALGFTLMGIVLFFALVSAVWVFVHRAHRVLRAAQPTFLYLLALGSAVQGSSILSISFDESYGWDEDQLSSACMATTWLISLGHIINYSALFTKLWRVNKVLQFSRRKIEIRNVVWPMAALMVSAVVILSLWNALDPLRWERVVTNDVTGESIGECSSDNIGAFIGPLLIVMLIPAVLTAVFAWKTKDVDDAYAESWWICALIVVQLEVVFVATPVVVVLRDVSTDGRYVGLAFMQWTFPMSTLSLVILPKVLAYYKAQRGGDQNQRRRRGEQSSTGVYVSGVSSQVLRTSVTSEVADEAMSRSATFAVSAANGNQKDEIAEPLAVADATVITDTPDEIADSPVMEETLATTDTTAVADTPVIADSSDEIADSPAIADTPAQDVH